MKKIFLILIAILTTASIQSQTINIELSHFAGKSYYCLAGQGQKSDTIAKGKLDKSGKNGYSFQRSF
jgi:hypothetical protein